jgi:hypothetical protein
MVTLLKYCTKCSTNKEINFFCKDKKKIDRLHSWCKECNKNHNKSYYNSKPDSIKKYNIQKDRIRYHNDDIFKLKTQIRIQLSNSFKNWITNSNSNRISKIELILKCNKKEFLKYIESKFEPWMNWNNYPEWELDHIIPLSHAKTEEEIYKLSHYSNIQPLYKDLNKLKKY